MKTWLVVAIIAGVGVVGVIAYQQYLKQQQNAANEAQYGLSTAQLNTTLPGTVNTVQQVITNPVQAAFENVFSLQNLLLHVFPDRKSVV